MQDSYSGKDLDAINSYQSIVWSLMPILAPLAGSYVQEYLGWRYNFFMTESGKTHGLNRGMRASLFLQFN